MKEYIVIVKIIQTAAVQANSEDEAMNIIKNNILSQDPKTLFEISVAEEIKIE